jgi:hypothetical protein
MTLLWKLIGPPHFLFGPMGSNTQGPLNPCNIPILSKLTALLGEDADPL